MNLALLLSVVKLVAPVNGTTVALVHPDLVRVMALPTYEARLATVKEAGSVPTSQSWRQALPVTFEWTADRGDGSVFELRLGKDEDHMALYGVRLEKTEKTSDGRVRCRYVLPQANLEVGTPYCWSVKPRDGRDRPVVGRFVTQDQAPRWIALEGRVHNIRDLGGWRTADGRRVRQSLAYRGEGLNDNRLVGKRAGPNRLTVEDQRYLVETLGIRTDLDLRSTGELGDLAASPMGAGVRFVSNPSRAYKGLFTPEGRAAVLKSFEVLAQRNSYPVYFHCIGGADRTGSLAYLVLGVLGVSEHDAETDWELTFYPKRLPELTKEYSGEDFWRREAHLKEGLANYGTAQSSWQERVEAYLKACGVTQAMMDAIREIMLERESENAD